MPDLIDGRQLMARAQAGDIDAFGELYARYRPGVLAYARRRHPGAAEDIAQDVFVRAPGNLHRWTDQGKPVGAWLQTITRNICADRFKKADNVRTQPVAEPPEYDRDHQHRRHDPADLVVEDLTRREVLQALLQLTDMQREAVILYYLRGLRQRQVAEAIGIQESAVKLLLFRARRDMAALLAGAR